MSFLRPKILLLNVCFCLCSCSLNAPHDNPLDPARSGTIKGSVRDRQGRGVAGALVSVVPAGREAMSGEDGWFVVYTVPGEPQEVTCTHPAYAQESTQVEVGKGETDSIGFILNGRPAMNDERVTTHHLIRSWPLEDQYSCRTEAAVSDTDGPADVDSVWCRIPELALSAVMIYDPGLRVYRHTFWAESLPGGRLEALTGRGLFFVARDRLGRIESEGPFFVSRIIYVAPKPLFPAGWQDTVGATFDLIWGKFSQGYGKSYHVEVVQIDPNRVVYTYETGSIEDTTHHVTSPISAGNYYWTVAIKDEFNNSCRSKEVAFVVRTFERH